MLRSGYSSEAVLRELSMRHLADVLDAETEKQLKQAGASAALLEGLRNVAFQASASQVAALEQKHHKVGQRVPLAASVASTSAVKSVANAASAESTPPTDQVYRVLKGDLVVRHEGAFVPYDDESLQSKKFFLFFFSANGSPAGRQFTKRLVDYYELTIGQHPTLAVVFFSADRSQFGMETYMNQSNMPWPAVAFARIGAQAAAMQIDVVHEIPCLLLLDSSGRLLSKSGSEQNGGGLDEVLGDLDRIFAQGDQAGTR